MSSPSRLTVSLRAKLLWVSILYFAEGFPFGVVVDALPVYFRVHHMALAEIGLLSLLGLPWTLKVFWSPVVDRVGERRQWIGSCLVVMAAAAAAIPLFDPGRPGRGLWSVLFLFTVASATQDIAIDAYTVSLLDPGEEGVGNGVRVSAYRVALIVGGGGLVALAGLLGWPALYLSAAALLVGLALLARQAPPVAVRRQPAAAWAADFWAWLVRPGAAGVFLFVLIYKLGDAAMGPMVKPFWVDRGLSVEEIGLVSTGLGVGASIAGALAGGSLTSRWGIFRGLWVLGLLQAGSNLGYAACAWTGAGRPGIYAASLFESFTGGLGTAAFLAFLMHVCERERAATQYALLSALFGFTRSLAGAASGFGAARLGYASYFALTFILALPAYLLLPWVRRWIHEEGEGRARGAPARHG